MKKIFLLLATMVMVGCTEIIDFDQEIAEPLAVLVSRPTTDSKTYVYLDYSRFFLDNNNYNTRIKNATMTLSVNGVNYVPKYDTIDYNGRYVFDVNLQPGDSLIVSATIPGYDKTVKASTCIPHTPHVQITDFVIDTVGYYYSDMDYYYSTNDYAFRVKFKINSSNNDEYYSVKILFPQNEINDIDLDTRYWDTNNMDEVYYTVKDPLLSNMDIEQVFDREDGFSGNEMNVSSELFQNGEHEFTAEFTYWLYSCHLDLARAPIKIMVRSLSKELYQYNLTTSQQSEVDQFFSEPVQVISNIVGGTGIFGGYCESMFRTPVGRFEHFYNRDSDMMKSSGGKSARLKKPQKHENPNHR